MNPPTRFFRFFLACFSVYYLKANILCICFYAFRMNKFYIYPFLLRYPCLLLCVLSFIFGASLCRIASVPRLFLIAKPNQSNYNISLQYLLYFFVLMMPSGKVINTTNVVSIFWRRKKE
jgi:hypothetical protein